MALTVDPIGVQNRKRTTDNRQHDTLCCHSWTIALLVSRCIHRRCVFVGAPNGVLCEFAKIPFKPINRQSDRVCCIC